MPQMLTAKIFLVLFTVSSVTAQEPHILTEVTLGLRDAKLYLFLE